MNIVTKEEITAAISEFKPHASATAAGFDFCKAWPIAKPVLEFLTGVPTFGWVIKIAISVGDGYASAHCK